MTKHANFRDISPWRNAELIKIAHAKRNLTNVQELFDFNVKSIDFNAGHAYGVDIDLVLYVVL